MHTAASTSSSSSKEQQRGGRWPYVHGGARSFDTEPSRVVPHRSTTSARPSLTALFGWEAVTLGGMAEWGVRGVSCDGGASHKSSEQRLNLSGSWQQGHSAAYNTPFLIQVVCKGSIGPGPEIVIARGSGGTTRARDVPGPVESFSVPAWIPT